MADLDKHEVETQWVNIFHNETTPLKEIYGYDLEGLISLEGLLLKPKGRPSKTLIIFMHPTSSFAQVPAPRALAAAGLHVLCASSRYFRNDTTLIMEKVLTDYGAFVRTAKEQWGYDKLVLFGWSGGGSLTTLYQSQAERITITDTPAGDPIDLGELIPGDAVIIQAAHVSRAVMLADFIDPSVLDETNPEIRDSELDLYDPRNPNKPPYSADYLEHFRSQQMARIRRRTAYAKELLEHLRRSGRGEIERAILTHRTLADPRWLDATIDPNDREINVSFMGDPFNANISVAGLARFSTTRSWLSQWSIDDSRANSLKTASSISVPLLTIEHTADTAVPQPQSRQFHDAAGSKDKTFHVLKGANHFFDKQSELLEDSLRLTFAWLGERNFLD